MENIEHYGNLVEVRMLYQLKNSVRSNQRVAQVSSCRVSREQIDLGDSDTEADLVEHLEEVRRSMIQGSMFKLKFFNACMRH
jgi:uncharacterized protein (UPF0254 family)